MNKEKFILFFMLIMFPIIGHAQQNQGGMNNPYVDDKLFHFGFSVGTNLMSFIVKDSNLPILPNGDIVEQGTPGSEVYHARVSNMLPGFSVGFIADLRLCKYLNLRFTPTLHFANRTITYRSESGAPVQGSQGNYNKVDILSLPLDIPLYLKFSAQREKNYRPYVLIGGGFQYNCSRDKEKTVMLNAPDAFVGAGAGCDIYMRWFKLCPEIRYQLGFLDVLRPIEQRQDVIAEDKFYTRAIHRLMNQMITISLNFE